MYVLDPYWFNEVVHKEKPGTVRSTNLALISEEGKKLLSSYVDIEPGEKPASLPLCISPPVTDQRMTSQRSVFTIHGVNSNAFKMVAKNYKEPHMAKIRFSTKYSVRKMVSHLAL